MIKQIKDKIMLAAIAIPVYAETPNTPSKDTDITITGENLDNYQNVTKISVGSILGGLIYAVFAITAIVFFIILIMGGIKWLTSGGDEKKVAAARASITSALIGLAIVFASWAIMTLLGNILGFSPFSFSIPKLV